jgi:hypothetical protein
MSCTVGSDGQKDHLAPHREVRLESSSEVDLIGPYLAFLIIGAGIAHNVAFPVLFLQLPGKCLLLLIFFNHLGTKTGFLGWFL